MKRLEVTDVEWDPRRPGRRCLTDEIGTSNIAINFYRLAPGDSFGGGYHAHHDQEEIFYIETGEVTFETENGDILVGPREFIRFEPGEFQWGYNDGDEPVTALGLGAPPDSQDVEIVQQCNECNEVFTYKRASLLNEDNAPQEVAVDCPECGGDSRRIGRPDG